MPKYISLRVRSSKFNRLLFILFTNNQIKSHYKSFLIFYFISFGLRPPSHLLSIYSWNLAAIDLWSRFIVSFATLPAKILSLPWISFVHASSTKIIMRKKVMLKYQEILHLFFSSLLLLFHFSLFLFIIFSSVYRCYFLCQHSINTLHRILYANKSIA